ncbi:MAG TPA: MBL fold metallo-hydrolase [Desulfosporosinus sp.]|nr:MBL fold metallo-hydrolase [Desulfosporosinus sp.]
MKIQLLRHATLLITVNNKHILVDPMLSTAGEMPPIDNSSNSDRNPLVELMAPTNFLQLIDAILLTHTHRDHFDDAAIKQLPKNKPILCQPEDEEMLSNLGFLNICPIDETFHWEDIKLTRTGGQHGTGEIALKMAPVSGYLLNTMGEPLLYIAGDTIYCQEIEDVLAKHQPTLVVVNAGGARFNIGDPITMTKEDVVKVCRKAPYAKIIAVHMEAINHCLLSRAELRNHLERADLLNQVFIPIDGETLEFRC